MPDKAFATVGATQISGITPKASAGEETVLCISTDNSQGLHLLKL
jgi:hypothetical protein